MFLTQTEKVFLKKEKKEMNPRISILKKTRRSAAVWVACASSPLLFACQSSPGPVVQKNEESSVVELQLAADAQSMLSPRFKDMASQAREAFRKSLQDDKEAPEALQMRTLSELSLLAGNPDKAREDARERLKAKYNDVEAMNVLIRADLQQARYESALLLIENALDVEPRNAETLNLRGLAQYRQGQRVEARESWKLGYKYDPTSIPNMMNLATLYFENRNVGPAGTLFEKILALQPQHLDARMGLALVKYAEGDKEQARGMLAKLLDDNEESPLVLFNLAIVEKDGFQNFEEALEHMQRYIQLASRLPGARKAVETGLAEVQSLKGIIAALRNKLSDEQLRNMASTPGGGRSADGAVSAQADPNKETEPGGFLDQDAQSLEDAIK